MDITTYSRFRQHLKSFMDQVFNNHEPICVTRANGEDVVVMSKSDYDSMLETFYLLKSHKNAQRLLEGIKQYETGGGTERELLDQ